MSFVKNELIKRGDNTSTNDTLPQGQEETQMQDGFTYTTHISDTADADDGARVLVCHYWTQCGACKAFRNEWNAAVADATANQTSPMIEFAVNDVQKNPSVFAATGASTVPHVELFAGGDKASCSTGPQTAQDLLQFARALV